MQNFEHKDPPDDDEIEISDLDAPTQGKPPLLQRIVKFAETHFSAKIRTTLLALVLLIGGCAFIYSFLSYLHIPILQQAKQAPTATPSNRNTFGVVDIVQSDLPPNSLSVVNGIAYIGTPDGTLNARYANDGTPLWQTKTAIPLSAPIVVDNTIYIASENSQNGHIDAFRASDGNLQWSYQTQVLASQPMMVRNGIIYVGTQAGILYALRASDGKVLWHFTVGIPANANSWRLETVLVLSQSVTAIRTDKMLYFLRSQDGLQLWHETAATSYPTLDIENGMVYIYNPSLEAHRLNDGKLLWQHATNDMQSATIQHNIVFMDIGNQMVVALNSQDGSQLWQVRTQKQITTMDWQNGMVLITTVDGTVTALQDQTSSRLWQFKPPTHSNNFWLSNTNNEVLYVDPAASTITFYALQASNGRIIWHRSVQNIDQSYNPEVINGIISVKQMGGHITIWSQRDGHPIWYSSSSGSILWNFIEERSIVYFQQRDGTILAVHVPTGEVAWRYPS